MKYIRRQNLNPGNILDDTVLVKSNGDIEFNPTHKVVINGDLQVTGAIPSPEISNVIYVTEDGDDANTGSGSGPQQAKRTLEAALAIAQEGTTVYVKSGEYYENNPLRIPPKVSVLGDTLRNTIIRPLNGPETYNITSAELTGNYVTVTTATPHGFSVGYRVRVKESGTLDISLEAANIVEVTTNTFTYKKVGTDFSSTATSGVVKYAPDLFLVNSKTYIAQLVIKGLRAPAYCFAIDNDAIVDTSPYIQNCSNINGPWMKNGTEWLPFITEQPNLAGEYVTGPRPLLDDEILLAMRDTYGIDTTGGGGGMLIDGDRYNSETPIKSMVADAFTQVAQGGIGFHITNFGYMQLVSCFAVFCDKAFYTTNGGYLSISNSVCDFGNNAFEADGFYPEAYATGIINTNYYSSIGSITLNTEGVGYVGVPSIIIEPPTSPGGVQAEAEASLDVITQKLNAITITNPGSGYDFQPEVQIIGGGYVTIATATANLAKNLSIDVYDLPNKPQIGSILFLGDDPTGYYISSTSSPNLTFKYDQQKCRRDVGLILNAVLTDMVFESNHASVSAGLAYLRSYSSKVTSLQKSQTIAGINEALAAALLLTADPIAQARITTNFTIVTDIINNGLSSVPALSIPDTGLNPGYAEAKDILQANKTFIQDEVTAWIAINYPGLVYDSVKCSRDIGYIIDALCYDMMFESNFRAIVAGRSYYRAMASLVISDQKIPTIAAMQHLAELLTSIVSGNATAVNRINGGINIIIDMFANGEIVTPAIVTTDPVGYNSGFFEARRLLDENRDFIVAELTGWIYDQKTASNPPFSPAFTYDISACERDVSVILDALFYDVTYGGNLETIVAARAYFVGISSQLGSGEKAATLATYAYFKSIISDIVQKIVVTPASTNGISQDTTGIAGSPAAATFLQDRIQEIYDTIDSSGTLPTEILPNTAWVNSGLTLASAAIQAEKTSLRAAVVSYINTNYVSATPFTYNSATCRRDISYIIDAMSYDLTYGGNWQTVNAASAYGEGSVIFGQVEETQRAYEYWQTIVGSIVKNIPIAVSPGNITEQDTSLPLGIPIDPDGPSTDAQALLQIIIDVVDHGTGYLPDAVTYPNLSFGSGTLATERESILDNVESIKDTVISYLNVTYGGSITIAVFPAIQNVEVGTEVFFHNVSTISTGGTSMEYVGSGVTYNALPFFGGEPIPAKERVEINNGKCFTVSNDQIGNFRVGEFFTVNALTGEVAIDAENLSLSGIAAIGPFKRNGIPVGVQLREVSNNAGLISSQGVQDINTVPTQYAVSTYVENRYLNKVQSGTPQSVESDVAFNGTISANGGIIDSNTLTLSISSLNLVSIDSANTSIGDGTGTTGVQNYSEFDRNIQVNNVDADPASITTLNDEFELVNDTATIVRIAGDATSITIGHPTGTTNIKHSLDVDGDLNIDGGELTVSTSSFDLANTTATTINFGGDATAINVGANTGETIVNHNLKVTLDLSVNGGDITSTATTFGLLDTTVTTLNVGGDATTVDIGAATGTTTIKHNLVVDGDTQIKGGDLTTDQLIFDIVNTTATTVNAFGAATTLNIGAATGTTHIKNDLDVDGDVNIDGGDLTTSQSTFNLLNATASTINFGGAGIAINIGAATGTTNIKNNLDVDGDVNIDGGDLTVSTLSFALANTTATTVNAFGAGTTVNIGAGTGTTNIKNNLDVDGDVNIDGGDLTVSTASFNLVNTTATTVNAFGAGTTISIGAAGGNGTLTVKNDNTVLDGDLQIKGGDLTTDQTTFNLLNTTATAVNFAGAATTLEIGAATGTTNINNNLDIDGDVNIDGGDLTVSTTTFNLANTTATTVNFAGAGTTISIGSATGTTTVNHNLTVTTDLQVNGNTTLGNSVTVDTTAINGILTNTIPDNIGTALNITEGSNSYITVGTLNGSETVTFGTLPRLIVSNITNSTDKDTGALVIEGGVGIEKNLNVGLDVGVSGSITVGGDLAVNGGDITSTATTFNLLNATVTTLNVGGASTATNIGAATGTTTVGNDLVVTGDVQVKGGDLTTDQTTFNLLNTTATSVNAFGAGTAISIGAATGATTINNATTTLTGSANINGGTLATNQTTFNLVNATATTVNFAGAATTLEIGAATGTTHIKNNLDVDGDVNIDGGDLTVSGSTFNFANTNITTLNAAGVATAINLAGSAAAASTLTFGPAITGNILKITGTASGTIELASDVTTGIVNLFTGVTTGTVNVGTGGTNIINVGSSTSTVNIGVLALTTDLAVQYGGTGQGSFTTNGVIYGQNTSGLAVTAASVPGSNATTSYGILTTDVSNVPVWTDTIDGGSY
jgi:hypothetical protein